MSYKSLVVHLDSDSRCADRTYIATQLALQYGAHLTGVYLIHQPEVPSAIRAELGADFLLERYQQWRGGQIDEVKSKYEELCARAGLAGAEFRLVENQPEDAIAVHARYADLLILGQDVANDEPSMITTGFAGRTMLASGRPVLILPYAGTFEHIGKHVLLPWNASREAARAVIDGLPFLERAEKVTVLSVNPSKTGGHGQQPGADIAVFLARHGVRVEIDDNDAGEVEVGEWLLSRAYDLDIDLIVMGGYGHSRLRELAFGGVTRTILAEMTVPVLMSH